MNFGLKDSTIDKINSVFAGYPEIERVVIYGSRAKGNFRSGSDIDLTIVGDVTHVQRLRIEQALDDLLLPYKIDLSLLREIDNRQLLDHIDRVGHVFYQRSKTR